MGTPDKKQTFQDRITQQWVILFGHRIDRVNYQWLLGPFGRTNGIGLKFIKQLAEKENLVVDDQTEERGLIQSIDQFNLPESELATLSQPVIDFYEKTSNYDLQLKVRWNPFFKVFGILLRMIFSKRIEQLNVPIQNITDSKGLKSEIIHLLDRKTNELKRTIWLRSFKTTGQVVYSGVYETCKLPSGQACIKAIFPLPNGSATVILTPRVSEKGDLILESSGQQIGDCGFYFLLEGSKGELWAKFIRSFKDKLVMTSDNGKIAAVQTLTLWNLRVLRFEYSMKKYEAEDIQT
ncbi:MULTISPECIES: hypothetical protein [Flavobacteriaceae]|uniref:hypothetical protein n=1 Tax=Flavobacteriaceae TaxID=49546 RepID=UPI00234BA715|nr:hypothetical protein [Muricauda sp. SP22]MDC6363649.1 hypothetical protein [Muricauda sp. SP22]